jgi:hypothetical protein
MSRRLLEALSTSKNPKKNLESIITTHIGHSNFPKKSILPSINNVDMNSLLQQQGKLAKKKQELEYISKIDPNFYSEMDAHNANGELEDYNKKHKLDPNIRHRYLPKGGKSKSKKNNKKTRRMRKNHSIKHRK